MSRKRNAWRQWVLLPGALALVLVTGVAAMAGVSTEDMIAEDGAIIIEDGVHRQTLTRTVSFPEGAALTIRSANGKIRVSSWDKDEMVVTAEKRMERRVGGLGWVLNKLSIPFSSSNDSHEEFFDKVLVRVEAQDNGYLVETVMPDNRPNVSVAMHYDVKLPRFAHVNARTSNGRIEIEDIEGRVETRTSNGSVDLAHIRGDVEARTSNGRVSIDEVSGSVEAKTSNGRITVHRATALAIDERITCDTSNGSVEVILPEGSCFDLKTKTSNGGIHCNFDLNRTSDPDSRRRLEGTVNGGGALVQIETSNGSIGVIRS